MNWCQGWVGHVLQSHVSFQKVDTALKIGTVPTVPGCNTDNVLLFTVNKRKSKKEKMKKKNSAVKELTKSTTYKMSVYMTYTVHRCAICLLTPVANMALLYISRVFRR